MIPSLITVGPFLIRKVQGRAEAVRRLMNGSTIRTGAPTLLGALGAFLSVMVLPLLLLAFAAFLTIVSPAVAGADTLDPISAVPLIGLATLREQAREKLAERARVIIENRTVIDLAEKEKRGFTAEEKTANEKRWADINRLREESDVLVRQAEAEDGLETRKEPIKPETERRDTPPANETPEDRCERVMREVRAMDDNKYAALAQVRSFGAAIRYQAATPDERRAMVERRALEVTDQAAGGYLQPPQEFIARLIQAVDNLTFIRRIATVFQVPQAESLGAPSLDNDPADPTWVSELNIGTEDSTMSVGKRELRPHPLAQFIKVSRTLLRKAAIGPEALVRERLAYKTAVVQESAFLTGNGVNKPLGVMTASADGISTGRDFSTGNTGTSITFDGLKTAKWGIKSQYWPRLQWIFHRDGGAQIDKLKDGQGQYIWQPAVIVGQPDRLLSFPVNFSEYMSNTFTTGLYVGILGDFSQYWIADALSMEIQRLNELYAGTNQVGFLIRSETDGQPVLEEAFARVKLG